MIYLALFIVFSVVTSLIAAYTHSKDEITDSLVTTAMFIIPTMATAFIWAVATLVSAVFGVSWCAAY